MHNAHRQLTSARLTTLLNDIGSRHIQAPNGASSDQQSGWLVAEYTAVLHADPILSRYVMLDAARPADDWLLNVEQTETHITAYSMVGAM
jgi:hypothetical protein